MTEHPITPPPALVQQWMTEAHDQPPGPDARVIATMAARWGADTELEACCAWLHSQSLIGGAVELRDARRPKPPSLNSIALQMLGTIERDAHYMPEITDTIRRALEALDD